jgi:hypothetical protein
VIPSGTSSAGLAQIERAITYAQQHGVTITVTKVK